MASSARFHTAFYRHTGKRLVDAVISLAGLLLLSPLMLAIAVALLVVHRQSPLFRQPRPGRNERVFLLYKFKSMHDKRDDDGQLLPDTERLTPLGNWLRRTSLDELPQLWNVARGDMSLIGPRPLLVDYLPLYSITQRKRHALRPGITGWAQVNGRNALSWEDKFALDVWYIDHVSCTLDLKIIFLTILKVFQRQGITSATSATMERFEG